MFKRLNEWHAKGGFWAMAFFFHARPAGRDVYGWWTVQVGLVVLMWLQVAIVILRIVEAFCV